MHCDYYIFTQAIKDKKKMLLNYFDEKLKLNFTRLCVPVHYGSSRTKRGDLDWYYLWDLGGEIGKRFLVLSPSHIVSMELTKEAFGPQELISMEPMREKDSGLAKRLVEKIRKTSLSKKKEPTEESNSTASAKVNTDEKN